MGDIYHAGEVYAGSVPIDDTQASEETVYSSAKVETMMEEIQEDIEDATVRFPNYSSVITTKEGQGVSYTATENCWAKILITATDTSTAIVYVDNVQVTALAGATGTAITTLAPLKKGQTISTRTGHGGYNLVIFRCL